MFEFSNHLNVKEEDSLGKLSDSDNVEGIDEEFLVLGFSLMIVLLEFRSIGSTTSAAFVLRTL